MALAGSEPVATGWHNWPEAADHCTRWRIPAQSGDLGAAARAKRGASLLSCRHETAFNTAEFMSIIFGDRPRLLITGYGVIRIAPARRSTWGRAASAPIWASCRRASNRFTTG